MLLILGYIIVTVSVFGGYLMIGGHLGALYQPAEMRWHDGYRTGH